MNFLLNAAGLNDDDQQGWDDDNDIDFDDDDDDGGEREDDGSNYTSSVAQSSEQQSVAGTEDDNNYDDRYDPNPNPHTMQLGAGLFMGRLTRFIEDAVEAVAPHDDNGGGDDDDEEEDGVEDGWDDDDVVDADLDIDDGMVDNSGFVGGGEDPPVRLVDDTADATAVTENIDGWDDDDIGLLEVEEEGYEDEDVRNDDIGNHNEEAVSSEFTPPEQISPLRPPLPQTPEPAQPHQIDDSTSGMSKIDHIPSLPRDSVDPPDDADGGNDKGDDDQPNALVTSGWEEDLDLSSQLMNTSTFTLSSPGLSFLPPPPPPPPQEEQMLVSPLSDRHELRADTDRTTYELESDDNNDFGVVDDGWDDDGIDGVELDDDFINQDLNDGPNDNAGYDDEDDDGQGGTNVRHVEAGGPMMVDHVPLIPPNNGPESQTVDATYGDNDDISRDDTLSMANSRSQYNSNNTKPRHEQEQEPPAVSLVDKTPSPPPMHDNTIPLKGGDEQQDQGSMAVLHDGSVTDQSSIATDTWSLRSAGLSSIEGPPSVVLPAINIVVGTTNDEVASSGSMTNSGMGKRIKPRRMVDKTPRSTKGASGDASMAVAGHTSVGESLDSIEEIEEEVDEDGEDPVGNLPVSAVDPSMPSLTPYDDSGNQGMEDDDDDNGLVPVVDHTPAAGRSSLESMAASVDVLSDSSEEGDLGESEVGVDDIKEDLYGPMVDHLPPTPGIEVSSDTNEANCSVEGAPLSTFPPIGEDDSTVRGHAEKTDVDFDIQQDEKMEDDDVDGGEESSKGEISTIGMGTLAEDNRSLLSGRLPVVDETDHLVDHVPVRQLHRGTTQASTMVMMDASTASSRVEDTVDEDGRSQIDFGPIVDQIPKNSNSMFKATNSVITQASGLAMDIKEDDEMDDTVVAGEGVDQVGSTGNIDGLDELQDTVVDSENHIVDHVPKRRGYRVTLDASVRVCVDKDDDMTQVDTIAEDTAIDYGPIVDATPFGSSRNTSSGTSTGVSLMTQVNESDGNALDQMKEDDFDNTTTLGEPSDAGSGWDNDEHDLEDISSTGEFGKRLSMEPQRANQEFQGNEDNLVDHVPRRSFSRPGDASTMVLVDPLDAVSEVDDDDDDTAGNVRSDKFGPVVDQTPAPPSLPVSVAATSLITQANDLDNDSQQDDEMDGTWFGASTGEGVSTVGASSAAAGGSICDRDNDSCSGWDDDGQALADIASPITQPSLQASEQHLVDHVPSIASPQPHNTTASMAVAYDPSIVSSQGPDDTNQDEKTVEGLFGDIVDHTPSVAAVSRPSGANSLVTLVTGLATDIKRDEDMDETTWQGAASGQEEGWEVDDADLGGLDDDKDVVGDELPHLVDHVPERPGSRPVDPSLVVAAEPSEMSSQVDDLNQDEDNFGPVVDVTPIEPVIGPPAVGSTVVEMASVLPDDLDDDADPDEQDADRQQIPNEWESQLPNPQSGNDDESSREQLVDFLPPQDQEALDLVRDASSEMATVDQQSTLPGDEPQEAEFGPVVDTLPPTLEVIPDQPSDDVDEAKPLARSTLNIDSVAPNFSVESKEKEDGLDDYEFGPVVDHLPTNSSRASLAPSRGGSTVDAMATISGVEDDLNTRDGWDEDTIDMADQASIAASNRTGEEKNYSVTWVDSVVNSKPPASETKYYDPNDTANNGWADDSLNLADDNTPPSTPRPSMTFNSDIAVSCKSCEATTTIECPCVRAILGLKDGDRGRMTGKVKTPEGDVVYVDIEKLLQQEATKRLLLEKENEALKDAIECLQTGKDNLITVNQSYQEREKELMSAIDSWQTENGQLKEEVLEYDRECIQLRNLNGILEDEKESLESQASRAKQEIDNLLAREAQMQEKIKQLEESAEAMKNADTINSSLQQEIAAARSQIAAKEAECTVLTVKLADTQGKLKASEAQNFKHTKEIARMSKDQTSSLSAVQKELEGYKTRLVAAELNYTKLIKESNERSAGDSALLDSLRQDNKTLEREKTELRSLLDQKTNSHEKLLGEKDGIIRSMQLQLQGAQAERTKLHLEITQLRQQFEQASSVSTEIQFISRERDVLSEALVDSKASIAELQKNFDNMNREWQNQVNGLETELQSFRDERDRLLVEIGATRNETFETNERFSESESQRIALQSQLDDLLQKHQSLESAFLSSTESDSTLNIKLLELQDEVQRLKMQLAATTDSLNTADGERTKLAVHCSELEIEVQRLNQVATESKALSDQLQALQSRDQEYNEHVISLEGEILKSHEEISKLQSILQNFESEHEEIKSRLQAALGEREAHLSKLELLEVQLADYQEQQVKQNQAAEDASSAATKLMADLEKVTEERDDALRQCTTLNEENEEMLMQFGLIKVRMDETDKELEVIASELHQRNDQLAETEERLAASEAELQKAKLVQDSNDRSLHFELVEENSNLCRRVEELSAETNNIYARLEESESEKSNLRLAVDKLRAQVEEMTSTIAMNDQKIKSDVSHAHSERDAMAKKSDQLAADIEVMEERLKIAETEAREIDALRRQICEMETSLTEQDRLLEQKDGELGDLRFQLNHGHTPEKSSELEALQSTIIKLENELASKNNELQDLHDVYNNTQRSLATAEHELQITRERAEQLRDEMNSLMDQASNQRQAMEIRLRQVEEQLSASCSSESVHRNNAAELSRQVASLETELRDMRASLEQPAEEPSGEGSAEIESLRLQIAALQRDQLSSTSRTGAREEIIEREVHQLQDQMKLKDEQLMKMQQQIQSLGRDLSESHQELTSKEQHVEVLSSELDGLRAQVVAASAPDPTTARVLEHTRDEAENVDQMRADIVALAQALERSEIGRAELIERIERERQTNAESLRRLAESVKRFYSTLSFGDN